MKSQKEGPSSEQGKDDIFPDNDFIEANGIEGGLRDNELQLFWEGAVWMRDFLKKKLNPSPKEEQGELTDQWFYDHGFKFTTEGFWKITDEILMSSESPYSFYAEANDNNIVWFAGGINTVERFITLYSAITGEPPKQKQ